MGLTFSNTAATTAAVTNRFVASANMKVGAYTVANASPVWGGGCLVTVTHTQVGGVTDTLGTIVVVGTNLSGQSITETITPLDGTVATSTKIFRSVTSVTGVGWVIDTTADTIVVGCAAGNYVAGSGGSLGGILVNNAVAATIVVADAKGTIVTVPASQAAGTFYNLQGVDYSGFLRVTTTSTNDVTVFHTGSLPTYATS
jgi:hypothetical protein